ncbi:MAG: hypothetical protein JSW30_05060 [Dehalococcoidia bacterium]|nr:MAG: hypothetical protein JSW30_05060 [Dehalococcoidia bacterium]
MSCFPSFNQYRYEVAQKAKKISKAQPGTWQDFLCELVGPLTMILIAAVLTAAAIFVKQLIG